MTPAAVKAAKVDVVKKEVVIEVIDLTASSSEDEDEDDRTATPNPPILEPAKIIRVKKEPSAELLATPVEAKAKRDRFDISVDLMANMERLHKQAEKIERNKMLNRKLGDDSF